MMSNTGKRILVVENSPSIRMMIAFTLKDAGYRVAEAVDGQDAFEKMSQSDPCLVLSNTDMPRKDGFWFLEKFREYKPEVPFLFLTTDSSDASKMRGCDLGATGWLVRPFDPVKLVEIVNNVADNSGPLLPEFIKNFAKRLGFGNN